MAETPPMPQMPPMGEQPNDMGAPDMEGGEPNDIGNEPEGGASGDVKKYSGELSQALNTYNQENPSDDEKVNKYAINMIAAQVADYLSDKDKRSVIKKLKGDQDDMSSDEQPQNAEMGGIPPVEENRIVQEIVDDLVNGRHTKRNEKNITNSEVSKEDSPFVYNN